MHYRSHARINRVNISHFLFSDQRLPHHVLSLMGGVKLHVALSFNVVPRPGHILGGQALAQHGRSLSVVLQAEEATRGVRTIAVQHGLGDDRTYVREWTSATTFQMKYQHGVFRTKIHPSNIQTFTDACIHHSTTLPAGQARSCDCTAPRTLSAALSAVMIGSCP